MIENMTTESNQAEVKKSQPVKRAVSFLILLVVIIISVGLFFIVQRYPDKVEELANFGYLGVFIISLLSSATLILPVPGVLVLFPLVVALNPVLVALAASTGGIIGEISGYMAGYSGRGMVNIVNSGRMYNRVERWMWRWGAWTIFVFAATPLLVFDLAGVIAGAIRYPLWKFLLIGWLGKSLKFVVLVFAMVWGWETLLRYFG